MEKNCLVTKLKSVVDNDNLMKLGHLRISVKAVTESSENAQLIRINGAVGTKISVVGDGYMATSYADLNNVASRVQELTIPANGTLTFCVSNGTYELDIDNKYGLTEIARRSNKGVYHFNIDDLLYCTNLTRLTLTSNNVTGDIAALSNLVNLTELKLSDTNIEGNIAALSNLVNLTGTLELNSLNLSGDIAALSNLVNLTIVYMGNNLLSGDISSFVKCTNMTTLNLINNTNITGSVETFVSGQKANGRASCESFGIPKLLTYATFGGNNYDSDRQWLSWDDHKIVVYCDTTGSQTIETASKIYAKGATTSEINSWEQVGKTVVVIE